MRQHHLEDPQFYKDFGIEEHEDEAILSHKREVRRMLEERLEQKRLRSELEDTFNEDEFD